jgi:N-acetylmuramoyl-L-alanine amidase
MSFSNKRVLYMLIISVCLLLNVSCGKGTDTADKGSSAPQKVSTVTSSAATTDPKTEATASAAKTAQQSSVVQADNYNLLTDNPSAKKVICIDPGHQTKVNTRTEPLAPSSSEMKVQNPGGAQGVYTKVPEYVLNLAVSQKLKVMLERKGYKVVMTRETNNVDLGNVARANIANDAGADLYIRIHADSLDNSSVKGISVLIPGNQYIKNKDLLNKSRQAGSKVLSGLISKTGAKSRGIVERNDLTGFNWARVPMMLIEMGFMSNPDEDKLLNTDSYRNNIAQGIFDGIEAYFSKL